ncbi:arylamine N-acetyltransferase [Ciona intestinalis]
MNVADYLARINYTGPLEPTLQNLRKITLAHKLAVPYTNMQMHGGPRIRLDLKTQYENIVTNRGGGVCYELNGLFVWLLRELGYKVICVEAAFFSDGKFTCQRHHLVVTVDFGDLGRYIVDTGWMMVGPMKFETMVPYYDGHHVYRLRHVPDKADNWYYLEKHKKTILDKDGCILKQGPSVTKPMSGFCDEECAKEESSHWQFEQRINDTEHQFEDFVDMIDHLYEPDCIITKYVALIQMNENSYSFAFGDTAYTKEVVDHFTDKVIKEDKLTKNAEIEHVVKNTFRITLHHPVEFFKS